LVNGRSVRGATAARTGREPRPSHCTGKRDAIFVYWAETLADASRREFCTAADQTLLALSRAEDRIGRIIVADAWQWVPGVALRFLQARGSGNVVGDRVALVRPSRLRRRDPTSVPALRHSYRRYDSILRRHVRRYALDSPAVVTFNPFVAAFCALRWASSVTYYAQDDCAAYPPAEPWWPAYRQAYSVLREKGTRIVCVSDELAAQIAAGGPAVIIPNGLNVEEWRQPQPAPAAFLRLVRPIVTYTGTIDDRLDTDLIAKVADDPAIGSVALIGHCEDTVLERKLQSIPKVALCGWMARRDLTGALTASDACIIPYVASPLTRAMSPLKMYDYLAAGKPVATTVLQPVKGISERVISALPEDFVAAVRAALELPRQDEKDRQEFLRSNSWNVRHERTIRVLLADDTNWWKI
jgi:teichuronic acid biosynthesis glycosyltransferase TuaH